MSTRTQPGETRIAELAGAMARIERRFGAHAVVRASAAERRAGERRTRTGTSLDRLTGGGLATGSPYAFVGEGTCGKLTLALRAVAAAQGEGGCAMWLDVPASFDPLAAERAGVALDRLLVVRARTREDVLVAAGAALRSDGFRLVAVDAGAPFGASLVPDDLAPLLPLVRSSTAALLVVAERPPARLALPTFRFERVAWERRHGRTLGWTFAASRAGQAERAIFHVSSLGRTVTDVGLRTELVEAAS
ncbi:MAG TPA: hypothetical protein VFM93_13535 [Candidatus Limnocylindria bacterium]|nr:hypothetical protein [Candidatus Limnocylindria bacterium]